MPGLRLEDFEAWDALLRGYETYAQPVEPNIPFRPVARRDAARTLIDDGRRPGFFEQLFWWRSPVAGPAQPDPALAAEPLPAREWDATEFVMRAPEGFKVREDLGAALLQALRAAKHRVAFELLGSKDGVEVQWVVAPEDAALLQENIAAFFPEVQLERRFARLERLREETEEEVLCTHIDFGLGGHACQELATSPSLAADPLIGIIAALENACDDDEGACLQFVFAPAAEAWGIEYTAALEALEVDRDIVGRAERKFAQPLFSATVTVSAWARDPLRVERIAKSVGRALAAASTRAHNLLIALSNERYSVEDHAEGMVARTSRRSGMLLSASELFAFVHVPAASVRSPKLLRIREQLTRAAPSIATGESGVRLGTNVHDGVERRVSLSTSQRLRHTYLIGASGTGKSTLLLSMILQDIEAGRGVAVLDPHGDLADDVLGRIPERRRGDVVLLDPSDEEFPIGLNVLGARSDLERTLLSSDLVAVFRRLSTSWGDQMNSVFANAIIAVLESRSGGTLLDLRRFLVDAKFRAAFLEQVGDPEIVYYWKREFPLLSGRPQAPILSRLDVFLRPKPIRHMVAQKERTLDFRQILDGQKILLARLSQGAIGEENAALLGSMVVSKLQQAALSRQDQEQGDRTPFFLYLDEFHHFVTPSLAGLLSGVRKYGMGLTLAHQDLQQISGRDSDVASAALSNPYTRVVFRVGDADAKKLEGGFAFFDASNLQNLGTGEAIARVERSEFDFNLMTTPLPVLKREDAIRRQGEVRALSRQKYATPRVEVEAMLAAARSQDDEEIPRVAPRAKTRVARPEGQKAAPSPETPEKPEGPADDSQAPESPTLPLRAKEPAPPTSGERLGGRGGQEHKYLQSLLRRMAEDRGYRATIEYPVLSGLGHIDLMLRRGDTTIACEISVTTDAADEIENVRKCLTAGMGTVVLVATSPKRLKALERQVRGAVSPEDQERTRFATPEEFAGLLEALDAQSASSSSELRGYKVNVKFSPVQPDVQQEKRGVVKAVITKALLRLKKPKK